MVTREELLGRARELVPKLRERATHTEELRHLPQDTIDDFIDLGLLRAPQPARYGGHALDYRVMLEIAAELGRGCGSSGWCYAIWASHNWFAGMFPQGGQEEYWSESLDTLSCTSFNPARTEVNPVSGGYRVTGHWSFSSGCDASTWGMLTAAGPAGPMVCLIPSTEFRIVDNWYVSGLRGSGSKDVVAEDVFVPEHRILLYGDAGEANTPGRQVHPDDPNYRVPLHSIFAYTLASPIVGMAQGALEAFQDYVTDLVSSTRGKMAESGGIQGRFGEASAEFLAARTIMQTDAQEMADRARRYETPTVSERAAYRLKETYVAKLAVRSVDRIFEASGGHGLYNDSPIQRFHRDAHAASHHVGLGWDVAAEQYSRDRFGLEQPNPRI
jgi:3-hydroxy-9,10-secoandrosta-1,3,5(10)-triene-9,17-dione monooxygenase